LSSIEIAILGSAKLNLIHEVEISYFRSFYKFRITDLESLNIIFGKNDSGKSNVVRALNLFFSGAPDHQQEFEFPIDFCDVRAKEAEASEDVRKFLYVKVTFNTPTSYQRSLGKRFYVKRQWTVSRDQDYHEEFSSSILKTQRHIVTRFLNKISFIYIPAIKDIRIFEMLLSRIHETVAESSLFAKSVQDFAVQIQSLTKDMFANLPTEVSPSTKIGAPTRLGQLFETLDFETLSEGEVKPKSLTRQRGDGVKARHIPELLNFISDNDGYEYHIWGFEEPENSLDFVASQSEAQRMLEISRSKKVQIFLTTHSPSFYLLENAQIAKTYVRKDDKGMSSPVQGKELKKFDAQQAVGEGFYLPAVAKALEEVAILEARAKDAESRLEILRTELKSIAQPVVLTEGRTDAKILLTGWEKRRGGIPPFAIRSCETGSEISGTGNGGAQRLAIRLKGIAHDHPHKVIGIFDYDFEGIEAYRLDKNFHETNIDGNLYKKGVDGQVYAMCLPAPSFRDGCKQYQNLPIEFLFRDEAISREIDGKRLVLTNKFASTKIGNEIIKIPLGEETHFKDVKEGKKYFAEAIVPELDQDEFDAFDAIFDVIEKIISA
jgi:hypothetical protein